MLPNAIAIASRKGGVGKTSLCANLAGLAAANGWRVLLVDLDPQGNLASDLGYGDDDANDADQALADAVAADETAVPLTDVRPGLDVVTGGDATEAMEEHVRRQLYRGDASAIHAINDVVGPLAATYNLTVIDCPPAGGALVDMALGAARFLVIPTRGDSASLNGLARTATRFMAARPSTNPATELLGVCLFGFGTQDTKLVAKARGQLEEALNGIAPVFQSFIRTSRKAPDDMRELGLLAHEYYQTAAAAPRWYENPDAPRYSVSAEGLAVDYQELSREILTGFAAKSADTATATSSAA